MATAARAEVTGRDPTVIWSPSPKQAALISCPVFEVFFGGARGGGKTDGVLMDFVEHADRYGEHAIGLMIRRERMQLVETIERSKQIYTRLGWKFQEQEKMWRASNGARLRFSYLERDADADQYYGHSYSRVYVEEIGTFPNERPILKLMATLRSGHGVPVGFRATGNPGGSGHQWVKRRYIDPAPNGWKVQRYALTNPFTGDEIERDRVFIPSRVTDNTYLDTPGYIANLQLIGSETLVRAWLEGDWSVVEGAFFDCWGSQHVIAPFAIPEHWMRYRSFDWGFAAPFAGYWITVAGEDYYPAGGGVEARIIPHRDGGGIQRNAGAIIPRGALVVYREWYGGEKPNVGARLTAEEAGPIIAAKEAHEKLAFGVIDPSAFKNDGGPPIAEVLNKALLAAQRMPFRPADNRKEAKVGAIGGWDVMRARLVGQQGRPMLYFFHTCTNAIRTIPALQHDPDKAEDIAPNMEDHAADAIRYACMARPWIARTAEPEPDKSELKYEADEHGVVRANMSVKDIVMKKMKAKRLNGY